ncbi:hypothetical protein ElyMa_005687800 [Elysia marginata]|uniref:Uncharacterized protein n=1 Tax=Elysia marginata TaxID=1093978 RepID=A0AAV4FG78_9GAST|nr:hypothetical protein ElyMa_005687800 [Elysia marginata]
MSPTKSKVLLVVVLVALLSCHLAAGFGFSGIFGIGNSGRKPSGNNNNNTNPVASDGALGTGSNIDGIVRFLLRAFTG